MHELSHYCNMYQAYLLQQIVVTGGIVVYIVTSVPCTAVCREVKLNNVLSAYQLSLLPW